MKANETMTRAKKRRQQTRLKCELYPLHTSYNTTILEEEKDEIACMGLIDLEGEETPLMFQEA